MTVSGSMSTNFTNRRRDGGMGSFDLINEKNSLPFQTTNKTPEIIADEDFAATEEGAGP